jgi:hypothetical protein
MRMYNTLNVDAKQRGAEPEPRVSLLDVRRGRLDRTGSNNGRDGGTCSGDSHPPARLAALHGRACRRPPHDRDPGRAALSHADPIAEPTRKASLVAA